MTKKKAKMGRPKSENPKNEIGRIRLTSEEMQKIEKNYGTFNNFVRENLKKLK